MKNLRKTAALHNLGCKVNAYELERIAEDLIRHGYEIVPFEETADLYVVNTCTVTNIADRKSRQMLHRAKKQNPRALVVALGCYVDTDPAGVEKDACIDIALGNKDKAVLAEVLESHAQNLSGVTEQAEARCAPADAARTRTRAFVKIQDGCNLFCSYCIIPYARGRSTSRPAEEIIKEVRSLAAEGVKEIVLTGIHISSYGTEDTAGEAMQLPELLPAINAVDGIERIRLGSLEPRSVTKEAVDRFTRAEKLCPHFHLSLQSGSDAVLRRMRRRYTTKDFAESVALLRQAYDRPALTTDLIAGFPGETEAEFAEGKAFVDAMDFYETHVFPFSLRRGTAAERMEGQLTQAQKKARAEELIALGKEKARRYREGFLGENLSVLWEEEETVDGKRMLAGYTERYVRAAVPSGAEGSRPGGISGVMPDSLSKNGEVLFVRKL
ncbi:MAG: tRNA (N(6)-L-threonylcarbamoyladenosine(37)-C(2))-methylthiotransferase MtaB [Lachnospiraceae bacterium]|nr:tRNA (N(6)-L-threonylcarbamoyladenosine(37)-C(2))-methylthiotransferase MtaB [Lachnospiraceae bacterium]